MLFRILLLISCIFILDVHPLDESTFSLFNTHYDIKIIRKECENYKKTSGMDLSCQIYRHNKTVKYTKALITVKNTQLTNIRWRLSVRTKNVYNVFNTKMASFEFSFCTALKTNAFGLASFRDGTNGNLTLCPIKPGTYYLLGNGTEIDTHLPPNIPPSEYQVDYLFMENSIPQAKMREVFKLDKAYNYKMKRN